MPEELLDHTQVCAVLQQMGGERMAEGVRGYGLGDTRLGAEPLDDGENHRTGQRAAVTVDKGEISGLGFKWPCGTFLHPVSEPLFRYRREGNEALLGAFAFNEHIVFVEIYLAQLQVHQFTHTKAGTV